MDDTNDTFQRFQERYDEERVPWDDPAPPPEIVAVAGQLPAGRALDVGCGYGRAVIYLAQRGWTAVGVDFVPRAIEVARQRAADAGVSERATFHIASAPALSFLASPFDLAIDVGCMHSFSDEMLHGYRDELARLVRAGGVYLLFAHLRAATETPGEEGPRGIAEGVIHDLFARDFALERVERGVTQVEDRPPWNSAWFWFRHR